MSSKFLACTGAGACAASFIVAAIPYLQALALVLSILASVAALRRRVKERGSQE